MQEEASHEGSWGRNPRAFPITDRFLSDHTNRKRKEKQPPKGMCRYAALVSLRQCLSQEELLERRAQETCVKTRAWCDSGGKKNPKLLYNFPMVSLPSVFSDTLGDKVTRSCKYST